MKRFAFGSHRRPALRARTAAAKLDLELLEDRCLLSDGFGYTATAVPFENLDLQAGQPGVFVILQSGDDVSVPVDLGKDTFNFYGSVYTGNNALYVSSNGLISLGA